MKLAELELDLQKLKLIKFRIAFNENYRPKNIKECIYRILAGETTYMAISGNRQCPRFRSRGISDIYRLCKFYFPNITLKTVLTNLKGKGHTQCLTTNQTVFNDVLRIHSHPKGWSIRKSNRSKIFTSQIEDL